MERSNEIAGELMSHGGRVPVQVVKAARHSLFVRFANGHVPPAPAEFGALTLRLPSRELSLGRCRYQSHVSAPLRRADDPQASGDGCIVFLDHVYDFASLLRGGSPVELHKRLEQLPILLGRKENIAPRFREYTAELVFDLQVYRGLFDEIDRNLADEPASVRDEVHRVVAESEYANFRSLFDSKLAELERQVAGFSVEQHERHGFYLRKHVWDLILSSEFLRRTNLKPSGYAGDSTMMRMVYENRFVGPTIFSRFMHRHPLETEAAQAVRNRVGVLRSKIAQAESHRGRPLRVMSVAAGPAWELRELFADRTDLDRYEITLLDQDRQALSDARETVDTVEQRLGKSVRARFVRDSVRTMVRASDLAERFGQHAFIYSMGLFDYLSAPTAKVVLRRLYELLEPGGELVVGNFHLGNRTRLYMEYWMDWVLVYRTENEMLELARGLPGAHASIEFEDTRSQMFLCVRKES